MVKITTKLSLIVQIVIGLISTRGTFLKVPPQHKILTQILVVETIVQYIELAFYTYFFKQLDVISLSSMARIRYYDWFFTTPTMLLTTVIYFRYEEHLQNNKTEPLDFFEVLRQEQNTIKLICLSNFLMLLFGYLGQTGKLDRKTSLTMGFAFFAITFKLIYRYAEKSTVGKKIFNILLPVWGLYGVAAFFNEKFKNNMFNILDIVSKNFFSLYIYNLISKKNIVT
jgi:hypothetical protein